MKICRYNGDRIGVVRDYLVFDITSIASALIESASHVRGDPLVAALPKLGRALANDLTRGAGIAISEVQLESPVSRPTKIIAAPVNYHEHIKEMLESGLADSRTLTDIGQAGLFLKATSALVGPAHGISVRFPERRTDHEVELVVVIGETCCDVLQGDALSYVAGYCLGLDITLRGPEDRSFRKSIDTYAVAGPWLTTADEILDPGRLRFALDVDGLTRQDASTADMVYDVPRLIAFASSFYTMHAGDLLFTGSPRGVGPILAGNILVARSDALGSMTVRVSDHAVRSARNA